MPTAAWATHPATSDRWADLETLFGARGACGGCWCMYWRRRKPDYDANKGAGNRKALKQLVQTGREPGLIGYVGDEPVAWVAVARAANPDVRRRASNERVGATGPESGGAGCVPAGSAI